MAKDSGHLLVLKRASLITLITFLSRIIGYFRDQRITYLLGMGFAADAFATADRIPSLLKRLVSDGAVSASFVPLFIAQNKNKSDQEMWDFVNALFVWISMILTVLIVLGIIFPIWVFLTAAGMMFDQPRWELSVFLNKIILFYLVFIGLSALMSGILNCFHRYVLPAFTPVVLNCCIILTSFVGGEVQDPSQASMWLVIGVVLGGVAQVLIQYPLLRKLGHPLRLPRRIYTPEVRRVVVSMIPGFLGVGVYHLGQMIDTQYASFLGVGSVSALYYADRVIELVLGGYAISMITAVVPLFSEHAASKNLVEMKKMISFSIRILCFITIPTMVLLMSLRRPIIEVLFQHGKFDLLSTETTAWALCFLAISLPFLSVIRVIAPSFYALGDFRTPVFAAMGAVLVNIIGAGTLFKWMQVGGLALSTSLALVFNLIVLIILFRRKFGPLEEEEQILSSLGKITFGSLLLAATSYFIIIIPGFYSHQAFSRQLWAFVGAIAAGVFVFFFISWLLRSREISEVWGIVMRDHEEYYRLLG